MTARHKDEPQFDSERCEAHGQFVSDLGWIKSGVKWLIGLLGMSAICLLGTFGAVLKYGMEMSSANRVMQEQIIYLTKEVNELKEEDKKICKEIQRIKDKYSPFGGVKGDVSAEHPRWSE